MLKRRSQFGNLHFLPSREVLGFLPITTPTRQNCQAKRLQRLPVIICDPQISQPFCSINHTTLAGFFKQCFTTGQATTGVLQPCSAQGMLSDAGNPGALKYLELRPDKKLSLFNGPIQCKYQKYDLYAGSRKNVNKSET